jgi:hypothetical protein
MVPLTVRWFRSRPESVVGARRLIAKEKNARFHLIDHTHARARGAAAGGASYGVGCNSTPLQQLR